VHAGKSTANSRPVKKPIFRTLLALPKTVRSRLQSMIQRAWWDGNLADETEGKYNKYNIPTAARDDKRWSSMLLMGDAGIKTHNSRHTEYRMRHARVRQNSGEWMTTYHTSLRWAGLSTRNAGIKNTGGPRRDDATGTEYDQVPRGRE
jgi:hypothetical protein